MAPYVFIWTCFCYIVIRVVPLSELTFLLYTWPTNPSYITFNVCVFSGSEPPLSPQVVEEGGEEEEEELSGGEESDLRTPSGRGSLLTRRGITLRVLLKDGLVEPGDGVLSIHYLVKIQ